jgi:hypothetical protein
MSPHNQYFVLHDCQGFEPADLNNFETVRGFVEWQLQKQHLKERIHGLWYIYFFCNLPMPLPPSSGSVQRHPLLEVVYLKRETRSYSNLHIRTKVRSRPVLSFNFRLTCDYQSVPLVLVFTQYDRLVSRKNFSCERRGHIWTQLVGVTRV